MFGLFLPVYQPSGRLPKKSVNGVYVKDMIEFGINYNIPEKKYIELGNMNAQRDWGYAKDYIEGMYLMLQAKKPDTYVLATNRTETVRDFVKLAFKAVGMEIELKGEGINEVGIDSSKIIVSNKTKKWYHPGRSGLLSLGSSSGPELAYFGEIHPFIIKKLDLRTDNVLGFEIILDNIPESRKKIREAKPQFIVSDYQKVVRDFAFVIDEKYSSGEIISLVKKIDKELVKNVRIFDVYQGDNIAAGKKSIAFNVTLEPKDKTLSDNDIEEVSKKIISTVQEITGATLRS